ncbi:hypothetical protein SAMN04490194_4398 [Pseudomonas migulae]|uniref:Uncharacterized protein n=1 Tax=Pseudomonas migulae TaxID=78543 RepID=A0A1H5M2V9_9PSED|nr:hypothetical protein FBY04_104251 [Pseudomonas sp. SJZ080]SEE83616.1 hypothetical protein SAMN04490194_4398 [Pseudomonas migulae]
MFSRALVEQGMPRVPNTVFRRCSAIITVNVPEEKTWIPD